MRTFQARAATAIRHRRAVQTCAEVVDALAVTGNFPTSNRKRFYTQPQ